MNRSIVSLVSTFCLAALVGGELRADSPPPSSLPPVPAAEASRVATVRIQIAPDRAGWTYETGEPCSFRVIVTADNQALENIPVSYTVGPELQPVETRAALVPAAGLVIAGGTLATPGFIRCKISAEVSGRRYEGVATAGFSPTKIQPLQTEPADFDAFWTAGKAELAAVPMDARLTLLPEQCTAKVDVYHVSFRTIGPNWTAVPARIYGILCEPKAPGRYPAILRTPGAGVRPYFGDKGTAERGAITLEIGIHGIPVNQPQEVYDALSAGALNGYWSFNLDDRHAFYFRRIYLGCVRANDFLVSRPQWDGRRLMVLGASQGGQLALVTAALDPRVTGVAATHPAFCDVAAPLHGRAGGWPHPFQPNSYNNDVSPHATPAKIATAAYYDTVNFARRVRVPGFYTWGYNDEVCPPSSTFAAYNVVTAPKTLALTLELAHAYTPEQWSATDAWLWTRLGEP